MPRATKNKPVMSEDDLVVYRRAARFISAHTGILETYMEPTNNLTNDIQDEVKEKVQAVIKQFRERQGIQGQGVSLVPPTPHRKAKPKKKASKYSPRVTRNMKRNSLVAVTSTSLQSSPSPTSKNDAMEHLPTRSIATTSTTLQTSPPPTLDDAVEPQPISPLDGSESTENKGEVALGSIEAPVVPGKKVADKVAIFEAKAVSTESKAAVDAPKPRPLTALLKHTVGASSADEFSSIPNSPTPSDLEYCNSPATGAQQEGACAREPEDDGPSPAKVGRFNDSLLSNDESDQEEEPAVTEIPIYDGCAEDGLSTPSPARPRKRHAPPKTFVHNLRQPRTPRSNKSMVTSFLKRHTPVKTTPDQRAKIRQAKLEEKQRKEEEGIQRKEALLRQRQEEAHKRNSDKRKRAERAKMRAQETGAAAHKRLAPATASHHADGMVKRAAKDPKDVLRRKKRQEAHRLEMVTKQMEKDARERKIRERKDAEERQRRQRLDDEERLMREKQRLAAEEAEKEEKARKAREDFEKKRKEEEQRLELLKQAEREKAEKKKLELQRKQEQAARRKAELKREKEEERQRLLKEQKEREDDERKARAGQRKNKLLVEAHKQKAVAGSGAKAKEPEPVNIFFNVTSTKKVVSASSVPQRGEREHTADDSSSAEDYHSSVDDESSAEGGDSSAVDTEAFDGDESTNGDDDDGNEEEEQHVVADDISPEGAAAALESEDIHTSADHQDSPSVAVATPEESFIHNASFNVSVLNEYVAAPKAGMQQGLVNPTNYDIQDMSSGDETDDESAPKKQIPQWAQGAQLRHQLLKQRYKPPNIEWGPIRDVDLCEIFGKRRDRYLTRTSSANWGPLN